MCSVGEISPVEYIHPDSVATEICIQIGKRVRELRKKKGWRQDDLALHMGLTRTYLSNLERGLKTPSIHTVQILALGFKMTLSEFLKDL